MLIRPISQKLSGLFIIAFLVAYLISDGPPLAPRGAGLFMWWSLTFAVGLFALLRMLMIFQRAGIRRGAQLRRPQDISAENRIPSPKVAEFIHEVGTFGFTRMGESITYLPARGGIVTWHLVNPDNTDTVEITDLGRAQFAILQFNTAYQNDAVLQTTYPFGGDKDFPIMRVRRNDVSISAAYQQHQQESAAMQAQHGSPRLIKNMADFLRWDERYREVHIGNRLGGSNMASIAWAAWFVGLTIAMFCVGVFNADPDQFSHDTQNATLLIITLVVIVVGILAWGLEKSRR